MTSSILNFRQVAFAAVALTLTLAVSGTLTENQVVARWVEQAAAGQMASAADRAGRAAQLTMAALVD